MTGEPGEKKDLFVGKDRLKQVNVEDALQNIIDMWWGGHGKRNEKPVLTSATIHYRIVSNRKARRR